MDTFASKTYYATVNEDGSFSVLARICSLDGTGDLIRDEEGYCLTPDDISDITVTGWSLGTDKNSQSGSQLLLIGGDSHPTVSDVVFSTLRTIGWDTDEDPAGYNFRHDLSYLPVSPSEWYLFEWKFTLAQGGTAWLKVKVKTAPIQTS